MKRSICVKNKRFKYEQAEEEKERISIVQYDEEVDDDDYEEQIEEHIKASCIHK